ncbi:MAG: YeeE/YedE family protein, partial [Desulfobacula sp.]|nr:YeeE/YedE family protein [Desulfobacula sp.]
MSLIFGLITGILFGFILQRSGILSYEKQVGALRLIDMAVFKLMLTAIIVGAIGIYFFHDIGVIKLSLKATSVGGQVAGGLVFGVGWALLGYCP